jgi:hypothetical protein
VCVRSSGRVTPAFAHESGAWVRIPPPPLTGQIAHGRAVLAVFRTSWKAVAWSDSAPVWVTGCHPRPEWHDSSAVHRAGGRFRRMVKPFPGCYEGSRRCRLIVPVPPPAAISKHGGRDGGASSQPVSAAAVSPTVPREPSSQASTNPGASRRVKRTFAEPSSRSWDSCRNRTDSRGARHRRSGGLIGDARRDSLSESY